MNCVVFSHKMACKVTLIGDAMTGKTTGLRRFFNIQEPAQRLEGAYIPTVGADVFSTDHLGKKLHFWDTAGDPKLSCLPEGYYLNTDVVTIISDSPDKWLEKFQSACQKNGDIQAANAKVLIYPPFGIPDDFFTQIVQLYDD